MKECESRGCRQWAQWAIIYPRADGDPNGLLRIFCSMHADKEKAQNSVKSLFMGAVPNGVDHTKYRPYFERKSEVGGGVAKGSDVPEPNSPERTEREQGESAKFREAVQQALMDLRRGKH